MPAYVRVRRSPYGERGLKYKRNQSIQNSIRRSPYGERGLKFADTEALIGTKTVALLTESVD